MNKKLFLFLVYPVLLIPTVIYADGPSSSMPELEKTLTSAQTAVTTIGGTVAVIGFIIAGILFLTSMGNTEKLTASKKAFFAAVIGTVLVIISTAAKTIIGNVFK